MKQQSSSTKLDLLDRRLQVRELLKQDMSQADIARHLDTSTATISRDVKAILQEARESLSAKVPFIIQGENDKLDNLEREARDNYQIAIAKRDSVTADNILVEDDSSKAKIRFVDVQAWERYDKAVKRWWDALVRVQERRAKLLGLDQQGDPQDNTERAGSINFIFDAREKDSSPVVIETQSDE